MKIDPDELTGAERAVLVGLAEATPKGARRSRATQDELMSIAGLKSRNGIDKVIKSLAGRGLVRHERARLGHAAAYELLFDEWVYDETARELRHPEVTQPGKDASPTGDPSPDADDGPASPPGDATPELRHPQGRDASPGGDLSPEPQRDTKKAAAAGGTGDQRGKTPTITPDVARVIAGIPGAGRSWAADAQAALDAGHTARHTLDTVNAPMGDDVQRPTGVRRARLRDLAATPADIWATLQEEYPTPHPSTPAEPADERGTPLCPEHGRRSRYLPTGQCAACLTRDNPDLDQEAAWMPGRLEPDAMAELKKTLKAAERNIRR